MNDHPDQLLAEYAEGTLAPEERAPVDAHLATCESCRQDLALAREARAALGALPELSPPDGLTFGVLRDARRRRLRPGVAWKVATAAAAAAVTIAGVFVVMTGTLPGGGDASGPTADRGGGEVQEADAPGDAADEGQAEPEGGAAEALNAGPAPRFVSTGRDYDPGSLADQGRRFRAQARISVERGFPQPATAFYERFEISDFPPPARAAARCILEELPPKVLAVPFVVQEASFEGDPVYVAAFLQGPAADRPYDRLLLWVLDREGCGLRYFARIHL